MFCRLIIMSCHDIRFFYDRPQILTFIRLNTFSGLAKVTPRKRLHE